MTTVIPRYDGDLFSDATLADSTTAYSEMRMLGPVVWLERLKVYGVTGYDECREILRNPDTFISGEGVGLNGGCNALTQGSVIGSDRPLHPRLKTVLLKRFAPEALKSTQGRMRSQARDLIGRFIDKGPFDAVPNLTQAYPLSIVCDLIGIPPEDRHQLLPWAAATFDFFGPENSRCIAAGPVSKEAFAYAFKPDLPARLLPNSAGSEIFAAVERGEITPQQGPSLMMAYLSAALDTTISSLQHILRLLAQHPDQWQLLLQRPELIPQAYEEALRLMAPVRGFARVARVDANIGGIPIAAGQRLFLFYAAANRDPRRWASPERFEIEREAKPHLSFGHGVHLCAGASLARLESVTFLEQLVDQVDRIEYHGSQSALNNLICALRTLEISLLGKA